MVRAFIGIGANLGDREATLHRAVHRLEGIRGVRVVARSGLHETEPVGRTDQPRFLNGVVEIETDLDAGDLLRRMQEIETDLGRVRAPGAARWEPRTIDLDLLLFGDGAIDKPGLQVPHPRLREREFVLGPLAELDPVLVRRLREGRSP